MEVPDNLEYLSNGCLVGWVKHGDKCFFLNRAKKNWNFAEDTCSKFNVKFRYRESYINLNFLHLQGHLPSVPDAETHEFLKTLGEGLEREIWIGGYQQGNSDWLWSDGTQWNSNYQGWIPGEPNARGSKCINMFVNEDHRWFDENCGNEYAFFCSAGELSSRHLLRQ